MFSYLKIVNAVYIIYVELLVMNNFGIENDADWIIYKNTNKNTVNAALGKCVQDQYTKLKDETKNKTDTKPKSLHAKISNVVNQIIKACSFIDSDLDNAITLNAALKNASGDELKYYKEHANQEITNNYFENTIPGYIAYISTKPKKVNDFDNYTTMQMKGLAHNELVDNNDDSDSELVEFH